MANIKSQKKRNITNEKSRQRNRAIKSELKTAIRAAREAVAAGDATAAYAKGLYACRLLDKAVSKGVRITVGYSLLLLLLGCVREWLSAGTVFGHLLSRPILPMAGMPAGGFIVLGVLCAVWRTLAKKQKDYLTSEARGLMAVYRQREGEPQDEQ